MKIRIGCTGWAYSAWQGTFYPKTIKQKDWLAHYSSIFDITEVNSSFYRIPTKQMTAKWNTDAPEYVVNFSDQTKRQGYCKIP